MSRQRRVANVPVQSVVDDVAIDWFVRLGAGDVGAPERARFDAWLTEDAHRCAFDRVVRLWRRLAVVRDIARARSSPR